jgi:hypothetical protein
MEEEQTTQWPKEKGQKDKQRSTKYTNKIKDRVTRTPLQTGSGLWCSGRVRSSYSTSMIYNGYIWIWKCANKRFIIGVNEIWRVTPLPLNRQFSLEASSSSSSSWYSAWLISSVNLHWRMSKTTKNPSAYEQLRLYTKRHGPSVWSMQLGWNSAAYGSSRWYWLM